MERQKQRGKEGDLDELREQKMGRCIKRVGKREKEKALTLGKEEGQWRREVEGESSHPVVHSLNPCQGQEMGWGQSRETGL